MLANSLRLFSIAAFLPVLLTPGNPTSGRALDVQPESKLWVAGTSTVRSFQCQATSFEAKVASDAGAVTALLAGEKAVSSVELTVPIGKLDCRNGTMNEHMRKALKATEFPMIEFRVASYELTRAEEGVSATLTGTLKIGGVERPVSVEAQVKGGEDGRLLVTGTHEVRMKEFDLKPPRLMLGTMRVDERIKVGFEIALKD